MSRQTSMPEDRLKQAIVEHVGKSGQRLTPIDLKRSITTNFGLCPREAEKLVKSLVSENHLAYTQQLGRTLVEISTNRPVHVGEGVILAPPDISFSPEPGQILIRIAPGASFGTGDHPTTRIALQLISRVFRENALPCPPENARVLDIGTGTGVLAIAACLMGAAHATGIDTDPCARSEALRNIRLNGLHDRITVDSGAGFDDTGYRSENSLNNEAYSLILANLRYPTLAKMNPKISQITKPGGLLIFSGIRTHETGDIVDVYTSGCFRHTDTHAENNWCGLIFRKVRHP